MISLEEFALFIATFTVLAVLMMTTKTKKEELVEQPVAKKHKGHTPLQRAPSYRSLGAIPESTTVAPPRHVVPNDTPLYVEYQCDNCANKVRQTMCSYHVTDMMVCHHCYRRIATELLIPVN